ncbi:GDP-mannose transporter GONST5 (Protein GOLGI NUCLEOTIDE SUGAR TRANSPORTER 5), partial [Durusdinium trenchii]
AIPVRRRLETAVVVISWFALNISIASSTKWIFVKGSICIEDKGCVPYKFPVAITVIHMIFSWMLCRFYIFHVRGDEKAVLSCQQQLQEIMPLSICFALSVAMGNLSLKYIYPSFNQMLGSMSPLITVLLAVFFQQKRFSMKTWLSMPVICMGLAMCSVKELNFNVLGAFYATGATVLRAVKSLIQGRPQSVAAERRRGASPRKKWRGGALHVPEYYMAPISAIWLFLLMLLMEAAAMAEAKWFSPLEASMLVGGVTLQVLGNVKSCLSIAVSVAIFRNSLTFEQAVGVGTCLVGVWLYNQKEPKARKVHFCLLRGGG